MRQQDVPSTSTLRTPPAGRAQIPGGAHCSAGVAFPNNKTNRQAEFVCMLANELAVSLIFSTFAKHSHTNTRTRKAASIDAQPQQPRLSVTASISAALLPLAWLNYAAAASTL